VTRLAPAAAERPAILLAKVIQIVLLYGFPLS